MKRQPFCIKCHSPNINFWSCLDCNFEWSEHSKEATQEAADYIRKWHRNSTDDVRQGAQQAYKMAYLRQKHWVKTLVHSAKHPEDMESHPLVKALRVKIKAGVEHAASLNQTIARLRKNYQSQVEDMEFIKHRIIKLHGPSGMERIMSAVDCPNNFNLDGFRNNNRIRRERSMKVGHALSVLIGLRTKEANKEELPIGAWGLAWAMAEKAHAMPTGREGDEEEAPATDESDGCEDRG